MELSVDDAAGDQAFVAAASAGPVDRFHASSSSATSGSSASAGAAALQKPAGIAERLDSKELLCCRTAQSGTWLVPLLPPAETSGGSELSGSRSSAAADLATIAAGSSSSGVAASPARKSLAKTPIPHPMWALQYSNIASMRAACDAPVDSMGCERCADAGADDHTKRFQTLVSLMLSSQVRCKAAYWAFALGLRAFVTENDFCPQVTLRLTLLVACLLQTKDEVTFATTKRLIAAGLGTAKAMAAAEEATIAQVLFGPPAVGFWRNKARFLKGAAAKLISDFGGDVPSTVAELVSLPGVGPKMAHICMSAAHGQTVGIGVDTHVHRIANRLGWVKTEAPEATRVALESFLPRPLWAEVNIMLVGFGQQTCQPLRPACATCLNRDICPTGTGARPLSTASSPARGGAGSASRASGGARSAAGTPRSRRGGAGAATALASTGDAAGAGVGLLEGSSAPSLAASSAAATAGAGAELGDDAPAASDAARSLGGHDEW